MKRIDFLVWRNLPSVSQIGDWRDGFRMESRQSGPQALREPHLGESGDDCGVERLRFVAVNDDQVGGRLVTRATAKQKRAGEKNGCSQTARRLETGSRDAGEWSHWTDYFGGVTG